ncbi:MAG: gamma-glutamyltransferase, partial [Rhodothermales bacterium]
MAATSHPLATRIAVDLLKQDGSAVDAAIGANAALGLMEPTGCGVGGDLFAIVWDPASRRLHGLNASGRAPGGLSYDQMISRVTDLGLESIPPFGPLSVSVPGAVDGWFELHGRFGSLPMERVLAPAVHYAREGFALTPVIAREWQDNVRIRENNVELIGELENFRAAYLLGGRAPREGEIFRNTLLAATYEAIARGGREAFYSGRIADTMDSYMRRIGGFLRKEDFEAHTSTWVDPVSTSYRGYDV